MDEVEIWKPIAELQNLYEVSNFGRVRSVARSTLHSDGKTTTHKSRILKQQVNKKGYYRVKITVARKPKSFIVHRLVAQHFIDNHKGLKEVNHKDEIKTNNHVLNLEWCDTAYNVDYSQAHEGYFRDPNGDVVFIRNFAKFSRENGLCTGKLSDLKLGHRKSHKGWTYCG